MNILVVNDDGISTGLEVLLATLNKLNHRIWVVVPSRNRSGSGSSISVNSNLLIKQHDSHESTLVERFYSCSGTPVDCVHLGLHLMQEAGISVDLVISGMNEGPNLADDWIYSGTIGAALEAAKIGPKSIAISYCGNQESIANHKNLIIEILDKIFERIDRFAHISSINIPGLEDVSVQPEIQTAIAGRREHKPSIKLVDGVFQIGPIGEFVKDSTWVTDNEVIEDGNVSVTSLTYLL